MTATDANRWAIRLARLVTGRPGTWSRLLLPRHRRRELRHLGPRRGIFPTEAVPGKEYLIQVPEVDADGNDLGGVRYPDMQAPIATWALRKAGFAEGELMMTNGCIKAEREKIGDPLWMELIQAIRPTSMSSKRRSMN